MICPRCKSENLTVVDTRKYDTVVIRTRLCKACLFAFKTQETIQNTTFITEQTIEVSTFESK